MVTIKLPKQLAGMASGKTRLTVEAGTLAEAFDRVDEIAPMLRSQLFDSGGEQRQFVGLFVDGNQVVDTPGGQVPLRAGSEVLVIMAVAGG